MSVYLKVKTEWKIIKRSLDTEEEKISEIKGGPIQNFKTKEQTNKRREKMIKYTSDIVKMRKCEAYAIWNPKQRREEIGRINVLNKCWKRSKTGGGYQYTNLRSSSVPSLIYIYIIKLNNHKLCKNQIQSKKVKKH